MTNFPIRPKENQNAGGDQARGLRDLVARRAASLTVRPSMTHGCHTIVVAGGKGGTGRSIIALNLAIVLSQRGGRVGLLDACPDLGSIELLCGLNGYWNLSHVMRGCRELDEVALTGPAGVKILSGANDLAVRHTNSTVVSDRVFDRLEVFERKLDWLIVDASGGNSESTCEFAFAADDVLIVATPEPTAVAEAYASVKSLSASGKSRLGLLVNQADSAAQAQQILDRLQQAAHSFLHVDLHRRGHIPRDIAVPTSVNEQVPFAIQAPDSAATMALRKLTQRWARPQPTEEALSFFSRLNQSKMNPCERRTAKT